jgi:hypothetical protein
MAETPQSSETPRNADSATPVRQGAAIGGWVCFALGALIMYWSVWAFLLYVPLFFVAFVLSIVAMAQRRIVLGVVLLLATIVIPLIEWFTLAAVRTNKFLDKLSAPPVNAFNRQSGTPFLTQSPPTGRAASPLPAPSEPPRSAGLEKPNSEPSFAKDYSEPVASRDAREIHIVHQTVVDTAAVIPPHAVFSRDGQLIAYAKPEADNAVIVVKKIEDLSTVRTVRTNQRVGNMALSPNADSMIYLTADGRLIVKRFLSGEEVPLPTMAPGSGYLYYNIDWRADNEVVFNGNYLLNLDTLAMTERSTPVSNDIPPKSKVVYSSPAAVSDWGLQIFNQDESYGKLLLTGPVTDINWSISRDLRHLAIVTSPTAYSNAPLIMYYLGSRPSPRISFNVRRSEFQGVVDGNQSELKLGPDDVMQRSVYAPLRNPLNGRIIGVDTNKFKGFAKIQGSPGDKWLVTAVYEKVELAEGDVVLLSKDGPPAWAPLHTGNEAMSNNVARMRDVVSEESTKPTEQPQSWPGERFADTRIRTLTESDISSWSAADIQYAINEIFARHGAEFPSKDVTNNFAQFSWYRRHHGLTFDQVEASLPPIEHANVQVLGNVRNARKSGASKPSERTTFQQPPAADQQRATDGNQYPIAQWGYLNGTVVSPYPPHALVKAEGAPFGGYVSDPTNKKIFRMPLQPPNPQSFPVAKWSGTPGCVTSPYRPNSLVRVDNIAPGALVVDPTTNGLFRKPYDPDSAPPNPVVEQFVNGVLQAIQSGLEHR